MTPSSYDRQIALGFAIDSYRNKQNDAPSFALTEAIAARAKAFAEFISSQNSDLSADKGSSELSEDPEVEAVVDDFFASNVNAAYVSTAFTDALNSYDVGYNAALDAVLALAERFPNFKDYDSSVIVQFVASLKKGDD